MKETTTIRRVYVVKDGQIHQEDYSIKLKYDSNLTKEENDKNTKENIETVHNAFTTAHPNLTEPKLLEISNNSPDELGRALAERELKITDAYGKETTVERLFKNSEMKDGDKVTGYEYDEAIYTLSEKELFYNWLYAKALQQNPELTKKLEEGKYDGFTDIYFNPKPKMAKKGGTVRTYTPSEAVANFVKLSKAEKIKQALENVGSYDLAMAFADIVLRRRDIEKVADEVDQGLEKLEAFKEAFEKAVTTKKEYKNKENESIAPTAYAMAFVELGLSKQHIYNHKEAIFNLKDMGTAYELAKSLSGNRTIDKQVLEESVKKADQLLAEQESLGIKTVTCLDENYPESFKLTNNPPPYFFYKGNIEALKKKAIAVIGTQNVGQEGQIVKETPLNPEAKLTYIQRIGKAMGERVANNDWALISGLNYGSDAIAQTGALEAKGTTIAISVTGLDEVYPKENTNLQEKIITENGIVISEYPIHTNTQTVKKNTEESARLKAALASGTMVVAIGKNDQAWDVLHASINQGKPVCYFDYNKQKVYNAKENIHTQGTEKIDQEAKRKAQVTQMSNPETLKEFFANCETRRQAKGELFTIGHSTHSIQNFKELLEKNQIDFLIDVRSTPYSKAQGQFNKENMQKDPVLGKKYIHIPGLGGSPQNTALADENGKVDYDKVKETKDFLQGKEIILRGIGKGQKIAIMGEATDPIDCHRAIMISHVFDGMGISAKHIMRDGQIQTQEQLNERVLDLYFPDRKQKTLIPGETKTQEDQLQEAYKKRNQEIAPPIVQVRTQNMNKNSKTELTVKTPKVLTEIQSQAKEMIEQKKYDLALQEISRTNIDRKIGTYDLVALGEGLNEKQKDFQDMMSKIRGSDQAGDVDIPEENFKQVLLNPNNIPNSLKPVFKVYNEVIAKIEKGDKEGLAPKNNESLNDFMGRVEEEVGNRLKKDLLGSEKTQPRKNMYTNIVDRKEVVSKPKQEILKGMYEHNVKVRVADKFQTEQTKAYVIGLKEAAQERKQKIDELAIQQAKKLTEQEVKEKMARDQEKLAFLESVTQQRAETKKIWEEQIEQAALKKAGPRPEVDENTPDGKKEIEAYNFKVKNLKEKEKQLTPDPTSVEIVKEAMIENVKKTLPGKIRQERQKEAQEQARDEIEKENPNLTDEKIKEQKIQERATKKIEERIQKETNWEITKIRGSKIETPEEELENLKKEIAKGPQQLSRESGLKEMSEYVKKAHIPAAGKLFLTNTNDVEIVENEHPKDNYTDDLRLSYNNKKILYDFTASPIVQKYNDGEVTYISKQEMPPEVHMYIVDHESSNTKRITVPELTESNEAITPETKAYINVLGKYADPKNLPNMEPGETRKAYQKRVNEMLYEKLAEAMPENKEKDKEAEETLEGKKKGEKIYREQTEKNENAYALLEVKPTTQADVNKLIRETNEYIDDVYFKAKEGSRDIVKRTSAEKESIIDKIISNKLIQVEYMKRATYNEQYLDPRAKQFGTPQEEAYIEATEQMTKDLKEVNELKKSTNYEKAAIELATDIEGYDGKDKQIENWQKEAANSPLNIQDNETINEYNRRIVGVILDRANKQLFDKGEGPITQEELMALRNKVEAVRQYDINKKDPNYRRNKNEKQYKSIGFIINDQKRNKGYINHKKSAPTEIYASLSENNQEIPQINAMGLVKNEDGTFNWDTLKYHKDLEVYWDPSRYTDAAMAKILNPTELAKRKDEYDKYKEYIKNKDIEKNDKYKKESQIGKTPDATSSDAYDNTGTDNYIDARNDQEVKDKEENTLNIDQYIYDQMIDTKQHPPIQTNGSPENTQHTKNLFAQRYGPNSEGARLLEIIDMGDKISENFIEARNKLNNYKEAGEKTIENMKMKVQRHKNAVASIEKQNRARSFEKYTNALGAKGFIDQYNKWENIKIKYGESNKEIPTPDEYVLAYKMEKQIEKKLITKNDLTEEEQLTYNKVQEFQKDTGLNAIGYAQMLDVVKEMENWQSVKRINRWQEAINGIINITEDKLKKTEAICNNISSEELRMAIKTIQAPTSTTDKPKIDMSKEVISEVKRIMKKTTDKTNINEEDMITIKESKEIIAQLRALEKETKAACTDLEERYLINYNGAQMSLPDYKNYLRWKEAKPDVSNIEDKEEKQKILQEYKDKCPLDRKGNPIDPTKIERIGITEVPKDTPYLQAMTIRINTLIPTTEQNVELKNNLEWQMSKLEENLEATRKWAHEKKVQEVAIYSNPQKVEIMEMATAARNRIIDATMPVILKDINAEKIVQTSSNPIDLEEMRQQAMVELTESVNRTKAKTVAQQIGKDETGLYKRTNPIESYIGDRVKEIVKNRRMADELEIGGAKNLKDIAAYNEAKTKVAEIEAAAEKEKELLRQKYKITKYDSEEEKIAKVLNVDQAIKSTKYLATTAFTKKEVERTILGEIGKKYQITKADGDKTIIVKLEKAIEETTQVIKTKNERNKTKNGEKESTTQEKEQIKVCQRMLQKIQFKDKEVASNTAYEIFEREKAPSLLEKMPGVTNKDGYVEYAKTTKNREAELQKAKNNYLKMCKDTEDALKAGKIDKTKYDEKMKDVQKEYSDSLNKIDSRIEEVKNKITKEIQNYVETCKKIENDKNEGKKTEEECETAKKEAREAHDLKMKEINITTEDIERDAIHADQFETVAHALINYAPEEIINIVNAVEINKISEDYNREIKEDNQDSLNNNNAFIGKVESNPEYLRIEMKLKKLKNEIEEQNKNMKESEGSIKAINEKIEEYNQYIKKAKKFIMTTECKLKPEYTEGKKWAKRTLANSLEPLEKYRPLKMAYTVSSPNKDMPDMHLAVDEAYRIHNEFTKGYKDLIKEPEYQNKEYTITQYIKDLSYECKSSLRAIRKPQNSSNWNKDQKDFTIEDVQNIKEMIQTNNTESFDKEINTPNSNSNDDTKTTTMMEYYEDKETEYRNHEKEMAKIYESKDLQEDLRDSIQELCKNEDIARMYFVMTDPSYHKLSREEQVAALLDQKAEDLPRDSQTQLLSNECMKEAREKEKAFYSEMYEKMKEIRATKIVKDMGDKEKEALYIKGKTTSKNQLNENLTNQEKADFALLEIEIGKQLKKVGYTESYEIINKEVAKTQEQIGLEIKQGYTTPQEGMDKYLKGIPNSYTEKMINDLKEINAMTPKPSTKKEEQPEKKENKGKDKDKEKEDENTNGRGPSRR